MYHTQQWAIGDYDNFLALLSIMKTPFLCFLKILSGLQWINKILLYKILVIKIPYTNGSLEKTWLHVCKGRWERSIFFPSFSFKKFPLLLRLLQLYTSIPTGLRWRLTHDSLILYLHHGQSPINYLICQHN